MTIQWEKLETQKKGENMTFSQCYYPRILEKFYTGHSYFLNVITKEATVIPGGSKTLLTPYGVPLFCGYNIIGCVEPKNKQAFRSEKKLKSQFLSIWNSSSFT
jgi:hypothetical protein